MRQDGFPVELQLAVIQYLDRESLKSLRLTSKALCAATSAHLFDTIHITPNSRSFDRARQIAETSHLAHLVRCLTYHLNVLEDVHSGFEMFRHQILRVDTTEAVTGDELWKYNCFLEEIDGQKDFQTRDEYEELSGLCECFQNLENIATILDEYDDPFAPPEDFIGRRTGANSACSAEGQHFSNLLSASIGKNLQQITALSASWRCLLRIPSVISAHRATLERIRVFKIGLYNYEYLCLEDQDKLEAVACLCELVGAASNAQYLHFDFDEIPFGEDPRGLESISQSIFKESWSSLTKLDLMGIAAEEDEILGFLQKHTGSLRQLHLDDVDIVPADRYQIASGSILSLFCRINERLTLEKVVLTGNFTNRIDESWYVDTENSFPDSFVVQLEQWLCHKAECPVPNEILSYCRRSRTTKTADENTSSNYNAHDDYVEDEDFEVRPVDWSDDSWVWADELVEDLSQDESDD